MIESSVLQRLLQETKQETRQETKQEYILRLLVVRFRIAAGDLETELTSIDDDERLNQLIDLAATCPDLDSFRTQLSLRIRGRETGSPGDPSHVSMVLTRQTLPRRKS